MPRKSRSETRSEYCHIIIQGDEKKNIFNTNRKKEKIQYLMLKNAFRNDVKILAYCLMDNHAHILLHSAEIKRIEKMMAQTNTAYGVYYNKIRNNVGHVFRNRYKIEEISSQNHLINCIKYIHNNPVKAKIVRECVEYQFSSYMNYIKKDGIFDKTLVKLCKINEEDYRNIVNPIIIEYCYMEESFNKEDVEKVINEINIEYDLNDLSNDEVIEVYDKIKKRCKLPNIHIAKILNIERRKLKKIIDKQERP